MRAAAAKALREYNDYSVVPDLIKALDYECYNADGNSLSRRIVGTLKLLDTEKAREMVIAWEAENGKYDGDDLLF